MIAFPLIASASHQEQNLHQKTVSVKINKYKPAPRSYTYPTPSSYYTPSYAPLTPTPAPIPYGTPAYYTPGSYTTPGWFPTPTSTPTSTPTPSPKPLTCINDGDVDLNGTVNAKDSNLMLKFVVGSITPTAEQKKKADINGDGKINVLDSILLQQLIAKKLTYLPVCIIPMP